MRTRKFGLTPLSSISPSWPRRSRMSWPIEGAALEWTSPRSTSSHVVVLAEEHDVLVGAPDGLLDVPLRLLEVLGELPLLAVVEPQVVFLVRRCPPRRAAFRPRRAGNPRPSGDGPDERALERPRRRPVLLGHRCRQVRASPCRRQHCRAGARRGSGPAGRGSGRSSRGSRPGRRLLRRRRRPSEPRRGRARRSRGDWTLARRSASSLFRFGVRLNR